MAGAMRMQGVNQMVASASASPSKGPACCATVNNNARRGSAVDVVKSDGTPVTSLEPGANADHGPREMSRKDKKDAGKKDAGKKAVKKAVIDERKPADLAEEESIKGRPSQAPVSGKGIPRQIILRSFEYTKVSALDLINQHFHCEAFIQFEFKDGAHDCNLCKLTQNADGTFVFPTTTPTAKRCQRGCLRRDGTWISSTLTTVLTGT